jgi:choline monooxygenase
MLGGEALPANPGEARPLRLLPGFLDEPLLLSRDLDGKPHCLSNVCTHRANLLLDAPTRGRSIRCGYHGRRFGFDGRMISMPEFEGACDFPSANDHLAEIPLERFGPFLFTRLVDAGPPLAALLSPLEARLRFAPWEKLKETPDATRDFEVAASWILYLDNYLEGLHIPFVHPALDAQLDRAAYTTELFPDASLQIGDAAPGARAFLVPPGFPDHGRRVAGYYFWLFPNTMLNVYPWGLSINLVEPQALERTRVRYLTYVWEPSLVEQGAGAGLDRVEAEDEAVVERVQRGVRSRLYRGGRFSPSKETGVHHFHRLLAERLGGG